MRKTRKLLRPQVGIKIATNCWRGENTDLVISGVSGACTTEICIMVPQVWVHLKPLGILLQRFFHMEALNWATMMPRDGSLSDGCTHYCCTFCKHRSAFCHLARDTNYHHAHTRRHLFWILLIHKKNGLKLPFSDRFGTKHNSSWCHHNLKSVITIPY